MKTFEEGDVVAAETLFTDQSWQAVDPTEVSFVVELPDGSLQTYDYAGDDTPAPNVVARVNVGDYIFWFDTTGFPGLFAVQSLGVGVGQATTPTTYFQITPKLVAA
jgi:hypothetical protein